jgi:hypothetical protein
MRHPKSSLQHPYRLTCNSTKSASDHILYGFQLFDGAAKLRRSGDNRQHSGCRPLSEPLVQSQSSVFPRAESLCLCFDAFSIRGHGNRILTSLENAIAQRSDIRSFHIPSIRASLERLRAILCQKRETELWCWGDDQLVSFQGAPSAERKGGLQHARKHVPSPPLRAEPARPCKLRSSWSIPSLH